MANTTMLTPKSSRAVIPSSRASTRLTGLIAASFMVTPSSGACHSEERSDEESALRKSRSFAPLRMTAVYPPSLLLAGGNEPLVGEREELVRVDLHAPHLPVVRAVVGERPKEGVGLLLGEDRMKLAVDRAALLVVEGELALDDQPVHFGVGIAAEVVLPIADLGRMEQRRDVRGVVEHPGRKHDVEVVLEEDVLLPRLPFLELDRDRDAGVLEIILEREHDALHRFALLLDRDLEREHELLAALLHDPVGAGPEARLSEQRARPLRTERQGLDVEVVCPAPGRERAGDDRALAVEEGVEHLLAVDRSRDRPAHAPVREQGVAHVVAEERVRQGVVRLQHEALVALNLG